MVLIGVVVVVELKEAARDTVLTKDGWRRCNMCDRRGGAGTMHRSSGRHIGHGSGCRGEGVAPRRNRDRRAEMGQRGAGVEGSSGEGRGDLRRSNRRNGVGWWMHRVTAEKSSNGTGYCPHGWCNKGSGAPRRGGCRGGRKDQQEATLWRGNQGDGKGWWGRPCGM